MTEEEPAARWQPVLLLMFSIKENQLFFHFIIAKYLIKFSLFSSAVVVGRPKSSLAPIAHFTSIKLS